MPKGGPRKGAGRKPGIGNRINQALRDKITDADVDLALNTLRYAMRNRKRNLKSAVSSAQYLYDQKAGRAPQTIEHSAPEGFDVTIRNVS